MYRKFLTKKNWHPHPINGLIRFFCYRGNKVRQITCKWDRTGKKWRDLSIQTMQKSYYRQGWPFLIVKSINQYMKKKLCYSSTEGMWCECPFHNVILPWVLIWLSFSACQNTCCMIKHFETWSLLYMKIQKFPFITYFMEGLYILASLTKAVTVPVFWCSLISTCILHWLDGSVIRAPVIRSPWRARALQRRNK